MERGGDIEYVQQDGVLFDKNALVNQLQKWKAVVVVEKNILECQKCQFATLDIHTFVRHNDDEHQQKIWCFNCLYEITNEGEFRQHLLDHCAQVEACVLLIDVQKNCGCRHTDLVKLTWE